MNTKHTPGPWAVSDLTGRGSVDIVAELSGEGNGWYEIACDITNEANARLIAKAPELLASLRWILSAADTEPGMSVTYPAHLNIARALIAEIEGETQ
jgi:hypothetical protein